jgi:hypothetical protein
MSVVETALLRSAASVVAPALKQWMGKRRDKRERETPLIDLVGAGVADDLGLRRASRRLDDIVDTVYERLRPLVRRDLGLPDNEVAAALEAVTETMYAADLSDDALFADDVDPALMAARIRRQLPTVPERAGLNEAASRLYGRVLDECCTCLTQLIVQLGPFRSRATIQTLERLTTVADGLAQVLARLPVTSLDAPTGTGHDTQFQARYLRHLLVVLDHLELFGVDVHRYRLRTPLSIAYISLAVTGGAARGQRGFRWNPGLLRRDSEGDSASVRAEQALGNAQRILLRGDAGSGKTTLLQWIAVTAARHGFTGDLDNWNGRTPFMIRLRDHVKRPLPPPERFLDAIAATIAGLMPPGWAHRRLVAGAILLVDGVDEVPESQRREVRDWLRDLLSAYTDLRVVVTSRPAAASARWLNGEGFTPVFLERMGPADIKALIRHWHEAVRQAGDLPCEPHRLAGYEQRLLAQLDGSPHLQNLAASPLLCAMVCALNLDRDSNLPRNRMDIYQAAVDMLLHRRDSQRGVPTQLPDLTSRDQLQLLQQLAWWLTLNGRTELSRAEAESQIGQRVAGIRHITATAAAVLDHMIQRSGILREPVPDRIDFVHRTFQEYLAAREAAEQGHTGALLEHAHLDTWRETIILAAGHANAPIREELFAGLLDRADRQPKQARRLRLLAAACLETAPAVPPALLARVRAHLREIVPRSISEARSLAAVGQPLLDELPVDITTLTEAQAAATIRAAALVNGPAALAMLAGYARDPRPRVQRQLIQDWEYFDPIEYADNVLADAPLDGGEAEIRSADLFPALHRLRHLTRTRFSAVEKVDLARLADVPHLTGVFSYQGFLGNLKHLAGHKSLQSIGLSAEGRRLNLEVLAASSDLTFLSLMNLADDQDLVALGNLTGLTHLMVDNSPVTEKLLTELSSLSYLSLSPKKTWDPAILSPLSNLEDLSVQSSAEPVGGLARLVEVLSGHRRFTALYAWGCEWVSDLTALTQLPSLERLEIGEVSATDLTPLAELKQLRSLYLGNADHILDLTPLGNIPSLNDLVISKSPPGLDLTPLRGKRTQVRLSRDVGLAGVIKPDGMRIRRPE